MKKNVQDTNRSSCRSPMAEAVFRQKVKDLGYSDYFKHIDSFGTGAWHLGDSPDPRSVQTCLDHGVPVEHKAQQISSEHFKKFNYVIAMDQSNLSILLYCKPKNSKTRLALFGEWKTNPKYKTVVQDPYFGAMNGFETNFHQLNHFSEEFLKQEIGELN